MGCSHIPCRPIWVTWVMRSNGCSLHALRNGFASRFVYKQFVYISQTRVFTNCTTKALCTYHTWAIWFLAWQDECDFSFNSIFFVGFIVRLVNFNICCLEPDEPFFFLVAWIGWVWFYWQLKRANCCRANDLKTKVEQVYGASRNACLKRSSLAKESCSNGVK